MWDNRLRPYPWCSQGADKHHCSRSLRLSEVVGPSSGNHTSLPFALRHGRAGLESRSMEAVSGVPFVKQESPRLRRYCVSFHTVQHGSGTSQGGV